MRSITEKAIKAFYNDRNFSMTNTKIRVFPNVTTMSLFGNIIAWKYNTPYKLEITNCGWDSVTTKERLNALEGVHIIQRHGTWFLNGEYWDGSLTEIK